MDYQIAIMSYDRAEQLASLTLPTLQRLQAPMERVTVFLANEEQRKVYERRLPDLNYVVASLGQFNAILFAVRDHYPEGTPLVILDDDIEDICEKHGDSLRPYSETFDHLVSVGFGSCERSGARMWGVYPVANFFYMRDEVVVGLRFLVGVMWGTYAGDIAVTNEQRRRETSGNDYETTLESYRHHGKVVRIDWVATKTKFFATGGIDTELKKRGFSDRQEHNAKALARLTRRYPGWCRLHKKASGEINLRLKTITHERYPREEFHVEQQDERP